jgi:hypothetical protein
MSRSFVVVLSFLVALPSVARAHCDTLDGPLVGTARRALETGKVNPVLAWVRPQDEAEIRAAFARATAVRRTGPDARSLADTWFLETVVRVHRAGEGAPYTGLKPAGQDLGPGVRAADASIDTGSSGAVEDLLAEKVRAGVHERFARVKAQKRPGEDVALGRAWVEAYVPYLHYVERVSEVAGGDAGPHDGPAPPPAHVHAEHR